MSNVGWLSTFILALCGIPLLIDTVKKGTCSSPFLFIVLCFVGEILGLTYVMPKSDFILIANYGFNSIVYGTLLIYKLKFN